MESHLGNGVGSSRSAKNTKNTSSSVDWLSRDMLEMKIRDKTEADEERVSFASPFLGLYFFVNFFSLSSFSCAPLFDEVVYLNLMFLPCCRTVNQISLMGLVQNLAM